MFGAVRSLFAKGGFSHKGRQEMTAKEWKKAQDAGAVPRNMVLVPKQTYQRAYDINAGDTARVQDLLTQHRDQIAAGDPPWADNLAAAGRKTSRRGLRLTLRGTIYRAVQPELRAKVLRPDGKEPRLSSGLLKVNKATNFLILGTSPVWAAMQFAAEGGQAAIQNPRLLNPAYAHSLVKAYHAMPPHQRYSLESIAGVTHRAIESPEEALMTPGSIAGGEFADASKGFHRTVQGRVIRSIPKTLRTIDTWKGGRIRLLAAMGKIDGETKGLVNHFMYGMGTMDKQMRKDIEATKGLSRSETYGYYARNEAAAHRIQTGVDEMMGNWIALTRHERIAAPLSIFYPFLRMSLRWTLYSLPRKHPVVASVSAYLGMQNAIDLKKLLHGDPLSSSMARFRFTASAGKQRSSTSTA